ncbi:unnamed protein product [Clavelina lepadiformis]|uniref:Synaptonemal complex protein 2 n=1 Tax=Clavelina lepadiformis TaxID=159417 RepID=A0ABP0FGD0_CLALP
MIPKEKQLESQLNDTTGIEDFLISPNASVQQECTAKFEPNLRRITFQAIKKEEVHTLCSVLRVIRYLCQQNSQKGIHRLISGGLLEILDKIMVYVQEMVTETQCEGYEDAFRIFMETVPMLVPLLRDKCSWFISKLGYFIALAFDRLLDLKISERIMEMLNLIMEDMSTDGIYQIRYAVAKSIEIQDMCAKMMGKIHQVGCYKVQFALVEMIIRIFSSKYREDHYLEWNNNNIQQAEAFLKIQYNDFEETARIYLNICNKLFHCSWVLSLQVFDVEIESTKYKGRGTSWVDLCNRSKHVMITFVGNDEECIHSASFQAETVNSYYIQEHGPFILLTIQARKPLKSIFDDFRFASETNQIIVSIHKEDFPVSKDILDAKFQHLLGKQREPTSSQPSVNRQSRPKSRAFVTNNNNKLPTKGIHSQDVVLNSQPAGHKESKTSFIHAYGTPSRRGRQSQNLHLHNLESSSQVSSLQNISFVSIPRSSRPRSGRHASGCHSDLDIIPETQYEGTNTLNSSINMHLSQLYKRPSQLVKSPSSVDNLANHTSGNIHQPYPNVSSVRVVELSGLASSTESSVESSYPNSQANEPECKAFFSSNEFNHNEKEATKLLVEVPNKTKSNMSQSKPQKPVLSQSVKSSKGYGNSVLGRNRNAGESDRKEEQSLPEVSHQLPRSHTSILATLLPSKSPVRQERHVRKSSHESGDSVKISKAHQPAQSDPKPSSGEEKISNENSTIKSGPNNKKGCKDKRKISTECARESEQKSSKASQIIKETQEFQHFTTDTDIDENNSTIPIKSYAKAGNKTTFPATETQKEKATTASSMQDSLQPKKTNEDTQDNNANEKNKKKRNKKNVVNEKSDKDSLKKNEKSSKIISSSSDEILEASCVARSRKVIKSKSLNDTRCIQTRSRQKNQTRTNNTNIMNLISKTFSSTDDHTTIGAVTSSSNESEFVRSKKQIAEKVNAQFQDLENTLLTPEPEEVRKQPSRKKNPFSSATDSTSEAVEQPVLKTLNGVKQKSADNQLHKTKGSKGQNKEPEQKRKRNTARKSAPSRSMNKSQARSSPIETPHTFPNEDEQPETVRRELEFQKQQNLFRFTSGSDESIKLNASGCRDNNVFNLSESPLKVITTGASKKGRVSFEPGYIDEDSTEEDHGVKQNRRRRNSKIDKLFDISGVSSAASTSSELSWVKAHKKNMEKERSGKDLFTKSIKKYTVKQKQPIGKTLTPVSFKKKKQAIEDSINGSVCQESPEVQRDAISFSPRPNPLNQSFAEIIEEEERRQQQKKNLQSTTSTITEKKLTVELPTSQYSHISVITTPPICTDQPVSPFASCVEETPFNNLTETTLESVNNHPDTTGSYLLPTSDPVEKQPTSKIQILETILNQQSEVPSFLQEELDEADASETRRKNNTTPVEPLLKSGFVTNPKRKFRPSKRKNAEENLTSSDESANEKTAISKHLPKKLNFTKAKVEKKRSKPSMPASMLTTSSNMDEDWSDEDIDDCEAQMKSSVKKVLHMAGRLYWRNRVFKQRPAKRVCKLMKHNMEEVEKLWRQFSAKRTTDIGKFQKKFSTISKRHEALMEKLNTMEQNTTKYISDLQQNMNEMLQESMSNMEDLKKAQGDLKQIQEDNDDGLNTAMKQLSAQVSEDLRKIMDGTVL